ncbi:MAG: response regulator transcription factor [Oscillospiraceae bacterium]|jgi:DNA-binding response OmpR family regulator|nr:response regulator transcription factor [Oscillospiraceae bacterium]
MKRILVCEDEDAIRDFVVINLKRAGYEVTDVSSGEDAVKAFEQANGRFDVALLDIMMPGIDGGQVCKILRERSKSLGIIMLSAKTQEMDKVNSLMTGADDYVTKPFSPSELVARVDAIHRRVAITRPHEETETDVVSGPFKINAKSRTISKNGETIDLTQVEYHILEFFIKSRETALDRKSILQHIWGDSYFGDEKIVDVNIRRLRMKIEDDPSNPSYIQTIWGFGYKWGGGVDNT